MILYSLDQDTDGVVEGALSLVEDVTTGASQDDCASLVLHAAVELDRLVFTNHDFLNRFASTEGSTVWRVESGKDVGAKNGRESFNTIEVGMFDNHDAGVSQKLLWVVVDQLSVDEDVGSMGQDFLNLIVHLLLLSSLNFGDGSHGVDLDLGAHNLNFIVVHGSVSNKNAWVIDTALTTSGDGLFENHTIGNERVSESATSLLDDLNVLEVAAALESEDGLDGEISEGSTIVEQELG